jgi:hypothetical protein
MFPFAAISESENQGATAAEGRKQSREISVAELNKRREFGSAEDGQDDGDG